MLRLLRKPKVYYHDHKIPTPTPLLGSSHFQNLFFLKSISILFSHVHSGLESGLVGSLQVFWKDSLYLWIVLFLLEGSLYQILYHRANLCLIFLLAFSSVTFPESLFSLHSRRIFVFYDVSTVFFLCVHILLEIEFLVGIGSFPEQRETSFL